MSVDVPISGQLGPKSRKAPEAFPLWNSPHSPCGRGSHAKDMGTLRFSVGLRLLSTGFRGICSRAPLCPLFHVPIDNAFHPVPPLRDILSRSPAGIFPSCSLEEAGGAGADPRKAYGCRQSSGAGFAVKWRGRKRGGSFAPVPRFRQSHDTAKIRPVKGLRVEIFSVSRLRQKKYDPSLDRPDRRSGLIAGHPNVTIYHFLTRRKPA